MGWRFASKGVVADSVANLEEMEKNEKKKERETLRQRHVAVAGT